METPDNVDNPVFTAHGPGLIYNITNPCVRATGYDYQSIRSPVASGESSRRRSGSILPSGMTIVRLPGSARSKLNVCSISQRNTRLLVSQIGIHDSISENWRPASDSVSSEPELINGGFGLG